MGVFLVTIEDALAGGCFPHACGGVSNNTVIDVNGRQSSPRLWGCFPGMVWRLVYCTVFPTPVGVFPRELPSRAAVRRLPHACGGVSTDYPAYLVADMSSPRLWGCFWLHWGYVQKADESFFCVLRICSNLPCVRQGGRVLEHRRKVGQQFFPCGCCMVCSLPGHI